MAASGADAGGRWEADVGAVCKGVEVGPRHFARTQGKRRAEWIERPELVNDHFVCSICGETHAGLSTNWAYNLPDEVWALSEPEKAARAKYDSDLCKLDDRHFIRCILPVPIVEQQSSFCWGAWAEVEQSTFYRYVELYEVDGSDEPPHSGILANALSVYGQTIGVPVLIQFGDPAKRPVLNTEPNDESLLAREQRLGIDQARHHEIVARLRD